MSPPRQSGRKSIRRLAFSSAAVLVVAGAVVVYLTGTSGDRSDSGSLPLLVATPTSASVLIPTPAPLSTPTQVPFTTTGPTPISALQTNPTQVLRPTPTSSSLLVRPTPTLAPPTVDTERLWALSSEPIEFRSMDIKPWRCMSDPYGLGQRWHQGPGTGRQL